MNKNKRIQSNIKPTADIHIDRAIASICALFTFILLWLTHDAIGFTRDEGYYFKAARLYWGYFEAIGTHLTHFEPWHIFTKSEIDQHWSYNHEHPVLVKSLFAMSYGILHNVSGLLNEATAIRLPAWIFSACSAYWLYHLSRIKLSKTLAVSAVLLWVSMPRVFWHMHLACFDIPVCAMHIFLVLTFWRVLNRQQPWWMFAVAFGLGATVKHNILVAPFVLLFFAVRHRYVFFYLKRPFESLKCMPKMWWGLITISPLIFLAHWPYLWPNPLGRIAYYLGFHLSHEHYPISYFGDLLVAPPFPILFPFVMSAVTIPIPTLLMICCGLSVALWSMFTHRRSTSQYGYAKRQRAFESLLWLNGLFPFLLIALPNSPIFGGTKHWMNGLPFWIVFALIGLQYVLQNRKLHVVVTLCAIGAQIFAVTEVHPYGLSYYNTFVGFERGAAEIGLQRTFWGYETRALMHHVSAHEQKYWVFGDTNTDDMLAYYRSGLIDKKLKLKWKPHSTHHSFVQPQGEFKELFLDMLDHYPTTGFHDWTHIHGVPLAVYGERPLQ